jgi:DNA-binding NtrC family response regulator
MTLEMLQTIDPPASPRAALNPRRSFRTRGFGSTRDRVPRATDLGVVPRAPVVLIAEDDTELRARLAGQFRAHGYWVIESADGTELLRRIRAWREHSTLPGIDLVICDAHLPGRSGLELLDLVQRERLGIPVIVLSGSSDLLRGCVQAVSRRAAAFFSKPVDLSRLLATARALIWNPS